MAFENKKTRIGIVVSDKMDKSITVQISQKIKHPWVGKYINKRSKYMADDPSNDCKMGDTVKIIECRPISKNKSWRLLEIINKSANI